MPNFLNDLLQEKPLVLKILGVCHLCDACPCVFHLSAITSTQLSRLISVLSFFPSVKWLEWNTSSSMPKSQFSSLFESSKDSLQHKVRVYTAQQLRGGNPNAVGMAQPVQVQYSYVDIHRLQQGASLQCTFRCSLEELLSILCKLPVSFSRLPSWFLNQATQA